MLIHSHQKDGRMIISEQGFLFNTGTGPEFENWSALLPLHG